VLLASCFSRWLGQHAIIPRRVSSDQLARYLRSRTRPARRHRGDAAALGQFVGFLRRQGVVPPERVVPRRLTPAEHVAEAFARYLRDERSLALVTVVNYVSFIRGFLDHRFGLGPVTLSRVCASDVVGFVQRQAPRLHLKRAKVLTTALRSLLRYGRYRGDIGLDLAAAVPTVANWSMSAIPRAIPAAAVRQVLAAVDRRTPMGRRDYAILLLLARLGLRAGEVASLDLDDQDRSAGQVSVRGKGGHRTALPIPADVGEAIAAYLRHGRPISRCRRVFLRAKAPVRGLVGAQAIGSIVRYRLARAGVSGPTTGAHQFRHALAIQMLRQGASLPEIGEVLRHRHPQTTAIFTKVDLTALRTLGLPWPGGGR
jgi:site-specific recombinase XerD